MMWLRFTASGKTGQYSRYGGTCAQMKRQAHSESFKDASANGRCCFCSWELATPACSHDHASTSMRASFVEPRLSSATSAPFVQRGWKWNSSGWWRLLAGMVAIPDCCHKLLSTGPPLRATMSNCSLPLNHPAESSISIDLQLSACCVTESASLRCTAGFALAR